MKRLWYHLKNDFRLHLKQLPAVLLSYLLLPLMLTMFMGMSWSEAFVPVVEFDPVEISLANQDEGAYGQLLADTLATPEMEKVFTLTSSEEASFEVMVLPDYSENLEATRIEIIATPNASSSEEAVLTDFIYSWQQELVQQLRLSEATQQLDSQQAASLQADLAEIAQLNQQELFVTNQHNGNRSLTGNQFASVTGIFYMGIMMFGSTVAMNAKDEFAGLRKRMGIAPLSPAQSIIFSVISNMLLMIILGGVYIVAWRLFDSVTFQHNPLFYLAWVSIYALFFNAFGDLIATLFPNNYGNIIFQLINVTFLILGMIPFERLVGGAIGDFFQNNPFRLIFQQPIYDYLLSGNPWSNAPLGLGLITASLVTMAVTILYKQRKELTW